MAMAGAVYFSRNPIPNSGKTRHSSTKLGMRSLQTRGMMVTERAQPIEMTYFK